MEAANNHHSEEYLEYKSETGRLNIFGFWIFLGAEIALFATLFATYAVLTGRTGSGPTPEEMFELKGVLIQTFILLSSSFTCGLAIHQMRSGKIRGLLLWLGVTVALGISFLGFEISEFLLYISEGASIGTSAFWSAFFVLAGTHGAHVTFGIGWIILIMIQLWKKGLTPETASKVFISSLYWHFLDVVWVFIFTGVYITGMVNHG